MSSSAATFCVWVASSAYSWSVLLKHEGQLPIPAFSSLSACHLPLSCPSSYRQTYPNCSPIPARCSWMQYWKLQCKGGIQLQSSILVQPTDKKIATAEHPSDDFDHHVNEAGVLMNICNLVEDERLCVASLFITRLEGLELHIEGRWDHQALAIIVITFYSAHCCE